MDPNLWQRRANNGKISLSTSSSNNKDSSRTDSPRTLASGKRFGVGDIALQGKSNPFNNHAPGGSGGLASPSAIGSSAFGLGSGAFASFGASSKPSKASGIDSAAIQEKEARHVEEKPITKDVASTSMSSSSSTSMHPLKSTWVVWYRPPTSKNADYEKSITALASISSVEQFYAVYKHLNRPSTLPPVSDYHIFKKGIRPVWEDEENKRGGKFIIRLKKGVADRYWELLLFAIIGDQFFEASEEVTGAVLSVRNGEDVLSVWTKHDGGRNIRIRETIRQLLSLPQDTNLMFKSHDASIAQRTALDEARKEKASSNAPHLKRRDTYSEDPNVERSKV